MTTIKKNEYVFSVDIEKTKEYYKTHSLCDCEECRNYYKQIKYKFPKLNDFLSEFGIDISKPDECFSVDMDNYIDYINVDYTVCGSVKVFVSPNYQTGEYFTISIMNIELPWVLNEHFPKSIALKENMFKRVVKKLFKNKRVIDI